MPGYATLTFDEYGAGIGAAAAGLAVVRATGCEPITGIGAVTG